MLYSNQIELRHIRYFLAVAEDLHFRKAAERLYISQPGLSRQIKQLEALLEVKLFQRHNRKVQLTEVGEYLKKELTKNLINLDHTFSHAKLLNDGKGGNLKFGYVGSAMQDIIPKLLLKLRKDFPTIVFGLNELDNQKQIDAVLSHQLDMGFGRINKVPRGLVMQPILEEHFCLVLPKDYPLSSRSFKNFNQVQQESFILFDSVYSPSYYENVMEIFEDCDFVPQVSSTTIHASSIFKLVENGFGLSIIPKSLIDKSRKKIQFIELKKIRQKTILSAFWSRDNQNPLLDRVIKLLPVIP